MRPTLNMDLCEEFCVDGKNVEIDGVKIDNVISLKRYVCTFVDAIPVQNYVYKRITHFDLGQGRCIIIESELIKMRNDLISVLKNENVNNDFAPDKSMTPDEYRKSLENALETLNRIGLGESDERQFVLIW